jgi:HNH endonuclease
MSFPPDIREQALLNSHRRCCVCHEFVGRSVNVHHIKQEADGGENTLDNAIVLCLRCHAEAGHYNPRHPLGTKYSPQELRRHRDQWVLHCQNNPRPIDGPRPELWCNAMELTELEPELTPKVVFQFENIGDGVAYDLSVETGIYVSEIRLDSAPPPMIFNSPTPYSILPAGRILTKTLPFARSITSAEVDKIMKKEYFVYAYAVLAYVTLQGMPREEAFELRTCHLYNSVTTYFQNTPFHNSNGVFTHNNAMHPSRGSAVS